MHILIYPIIQDWRVLGAQPGVEQPGLRALFLVRRTSLRQTGAVLPKARQGNW